MELQTQNSGSVAVTPTFIQKIEQFLAAKPIILQLLRFGAIGVFNTAMDVLVLNYMATQFGVTKGGSIGWVNIPGFFLAVIQSYFWNKYWAFDSAHVSLIKNFFRLAGVGFVGVVIYALVAVGAHLHTRPIYFIGIFSVFVLAQIVLWYVYGFFNTQPQTSQKIYLSFFVVSIIGFAINSGVLYLTTTHLLHTANSGDNLNIGKVLATIVSLVWNFIGYKLFVFKK